MGFHAEYRGPSYVQSFFPTRGTPGPPPAGKRFGAQEDRRGEAFPTERETAEGGIYPAAENAARDAPANDAPA